MSRGTSGDDVGSGADHQNAGAGRLIPPCPEMPARRIERLIRWPAADEPGRFVVRCSCRRWTFTGTAAEAAAASRRHDDSPWTHHVVSIWGKVIPAHLEEAEAS